ncbi:MAG: cytochrome c oxidase accessory protein CcoG [Sphingomonas sp.]|nr:cytochrome c oxidase accessory protein CcoG [Sphingomonas sp.]
MTDLSNTKSNSLYARRKPVYPQKIDGPFRRLKWAVMAIALTVYYVTPWLRWDRGPYAPDQAVLVDLAHRRFYFGPLEIWPHEFYYVAGMLIMAGIGLFLLTSAVGRAWCGYACPQTVWTDVFQHVDRFIDGDRNAQMRLAKAPWTAGKIARRGLKYAIYLLISVATGGAWIFYFADAPDLARKFIAGEASYIAYSTVAILTATTFTLGGFMREQVCVYMCPWPRIQAAMMDEKSLTVTYKDWRGEPRGRGRREATLSDLGLGDCIDCNQCVAVCPTGIDIRNGPQIGCITCALCIDACDRVMAKIGKPRGLIDYATLEDCDIERKGGKARSLFRTVFRPRTIAYASLWGAVGLAMLVALGNRTRLDISAQQVRNPVYVKLSSGEIRNRYTVKLRNMQTRPREMEVSIDRLAGATMWQEGQTREQAATRLRTTVPADALAKLPIFVVAPGSGKGSETFILSVRSVDGEEEHDSTEAIFERPEN